MKNLPIGIQTFRDFVQDNYLYVDKTKLIHDLFARGGRYYFLSRPRRFGKSLLISTLAEIFSGNKELFKGLWIYDKIEWIPHPVVHLDLTNISFKTPEILEKALEDRVEQIAGEYGIQLDQHLFLKEKFRQLLKNLAEKQKAVVLIDEYDKPMIEHLEKGEIETAQEMQRVLKSFYSIIKAADAFLRFVFITGVSKFTKVSVFSDLNNLRDITLSTQYATLLGYTGKELAHYFEPYIEGLAAKTGLSKDQLQTEIRKWYNGYSWDGENFVYNPFSILHLFEEKSFGNYWFSTGTPSFLIRLIKNQEIDIREFENLPVYSHAFDSEDIESLDPVSVLFQTGYLTVKKITFTTGKKTYELSYPNHEVRDSFLTFLFGEYTQKKTGTNTRLMEQFGSALAADDIERFLGELKTLFASIPYHIFIGDKEAYYHSVIYLVLRLNGAVVTAEDPTNLGRIDAVCETKQSIYIMEFKIGSHQEALKQIKEKKYYEKYLESNKRIVLVGIGFDSGTRNIGEYLVEILRDSSNK